jgi:Na+-translocating ferredoxin:NAD+ oxidoreductase subunit B
MNQDIYEQLREGMDKIGSGFNATESGVEIKILKRLFTAEEAQMYLACTQKMEPIAAIARRLNLKPERIAPVLKQMAKKGLLFSSPSKAKGETPTHFAAAPWLGGLMEVQTFTMDGDLAQLCVQYLTGGFKKKGNFLRVIPVNQKISVNWRVAPYDDVREIIKSKDRILVMPCPCVNLAEAMGREIDQPREICFQFGFYADFHFDKGIGRWVSQEEALGILQQCEEAGLMHRPTDTPTVDAICNCGKFCGGLIMFKHHPRPGEICSSNYYTQVDSSLCIGCGMCVPRCHMEAITVNQDMVAAIDRNRCIGCGLCVSVCPTQALSLHVKPEEERMSPSESNPNWRSSQEFARDME